MVRKTVFLSLIIFLIVWVVSCGPPGSVFQEDEELQAALVTIPSGSFVTENTPIPLSIVTLEDGAYPDKLDIILKDADGRVLSSDTMEDEELTGESLPDLFIPSLEPGLYVLELSLFDGEMLIGEETTEFFFVEGEYVILGISSFPPVIAPSSTALFSLNLKIPDEADPYIVWSVGSTILSAGLFSEGGGELQWEVPETEGIYSVKSEVYPFSPGGGVVFPFNSQHYMNAEVFVTSHISRSDDELGPESSYWTLFHFRGNLKDASESGSDRKAVPNESAEFAVRGGIFGFSLAQESGFTIPEMLLPVVRGSIQPFSLSLRLLLTEIGPGGNLITMESGDGELSLGMFINERGQVGADLRAASSRRIVDSGESVVSTGTAHIITASFNPGPEETEISLYIDGLKTGEGYGFFPESLASGEGATVIGGSSGYAGVLDEMGVYYSSGSGVAGIDPDVYERGAAELYGDELLFAEGFDGLFLPEKLEYRGNAVIQGGFLVVPENGSVELPELAFSYERLVTELETPEESPLGSVTLFLAGSNGREEVCTVTFAGEGTLSSGERFTIDSADKVVRLVLDHNESGLYLATENGLILVRGEPGDPSALQILIENGDTEASLSIDRILVYTETPNLVKEKSQTREEETLPGVPVNV